MRIPASGRDTTSRLVASKYRPIPPDTFVLAFRVTRYVAAKRGETEACRIMLSRSNRSPAYNSIRSEIDQRSCAKPLASKLLRLNCELPLKLIWRERVPFSRKIKIGRRDAD